MSQITRSLAIALAAVVMVGTAGAAAPSANVAGMTTIGLRGFVPVVCRVSLDASATSTLAGKRTLGTMNEFCNSPAGYRVVANYSPTLASARLVVDGIAIPLDRSGSVVVSQSDHAGIAARAVRLELPYDTAPGSLRFRIEAR